MKMSVLLLALCLAAVGCDKKANTVEIDENTPTESLEEETTESADMASDEGAEPDGASFFREVELEGGPFDEEVQVLVVKVAGDGPTEAALTRAFSSDRISGKFEAAPGDKLEIKQSMMVITKARPLTVKKEKLRLPATTFNDSTQKFGADEVLEFTKGDVVHMLKYAAEGTCFVGWKGLIYNMTCPTDVEFESPDWDGTPRPLEYDWFILTASGATRGWLKVDGVNFVHEVDEKATKRLKRKLRKKRRR